jgi:hypothetical protein
MKRFISLSLNSTTRKIWAEKTFDLTNIGAGALLFGQFLSEKRFSWTTTILSITLVIIGYVTSYLLSKNL